MATNQALFQYCLRLGDTNLILGHRLAEMCSRAPTLEEDIALTNFALDHIGQAEALLQYAAQVEGAGRTEDSLAYLRNAEEFLNLRLVEQPNTDFAYVIARQFMVDVYQCLLYQKLQASSDETLAGMAARFLKESMYHLRHSSAWVERLGLGTEESRRRIQKAFDDLWSFHTEFWSPQLYESVLAHLGIAPESKDLELEWTVQAVRVLAKAGLHTPSTHGYNKSNFAHHTEYLSRLLAEMQYLPRNYPDARW